MSARKRGYVITNPKRLILYIVGASVRRQRAEPEPRGRLPDTALGDSAGQQPQWRRRRQRWPGLRRVLAAGGHPRHPPAARALDRRRPQAPAARLRPPSRGGRRSRSRYSRPYCTPAALPLAHVNVLLPL